MISNSNSVFFLDLGVFLQYFTFSIIIISVCSGGSLRSYFMQSFCGYLPGSYVDQCKSEILSSTRTPPQWVFFALIVPYMILVRDGNVTRYLDRSNCVAAAVPCYFDVSRFRISRLEKIYCSRVRSHAKTLAGWAVWCFIKIPGNWFWENRLRLCTTVFTGIHSDQQISVRLNWKA